MPGSVDLKRPLLAVASLKTYSPPPHLRRVHCLGGRDGSNGRHSRCSIYDASSVPAGALSALRDACQFALWQQQHVLCPLICCQGTVQHIDACVCVGGGEGLKCKGQ